MKSTETLSRSTIIAKISATQNKITEAKEKAIRFAEPILSRKGEAVLFPRTINVIQGKAGAHKSRLAETICAALLQVTKSGGKELLAFQRDENTEFTLCYVDTERNLSDQLPHALQRIQINAGYNIQDRPSGFEYISLLEFERDVRFQALNIYLEEIRNGYRGHLFVVLDVITDCIFNFNDTKDSMQLIDMMNRSINTNDATFLCLIHENPGKGEKARGHLGTEILNKASTVMQIGFVNDNKNQRTDLIKLCYKKCRNSRRYDDVYLQYCEKSDSLIPADLLLINVVNSAKQFRAPLAELIEAISTFITQSISRQDLIQVLSEHLGCGKRTIITRLKKVIGERITIPQNGKNMILKAEISKKELIYCLEETAD